MIKSLLAESGKLLLKLIAAVVFACMISYLVYVMSLKAMRDMTDKAMSDMKKEQLDITNERDEAREAITGEKPDRNR